MTRDTPRETYLLPLVAVRVPNVQVNRLCGDDWIDFREDLLSGHSSAQPLRTHELHGTALLVGDERSGFEGNGGVRIHLSHFNFDLEIWASVSPCCAGEVDKHTCDILHMTRRLGGRP
jgi:hypothetical protein